jgi:hypothetical protein
VEALCASEERVSGEKANESFSTKSAQNTSSKFGSNGEIDSEGTRKDGSLASYDSHGNV